MFDHLFPTFFDGADETAAAVSETPPVEAAPAAAAVAPPQPAPWTADLEKYITDPAARAEADRYMREVQQPRMTELENSPAARLHRDLVSEEKQDSTVAAIVAHIYGDEYAQKFVALFGEEGEGLEPGQTIEEGVQEANETTDDPDKAWVAQKREEEQAAAEAAEYDALMDRVVGDEGNAEWRTLLNDPSFTLTAEDKPLLGPFMDGSETVGEAVTKYAAYVKSFATKHGLTPAQAEVKPEPPATLNSEGSTAATPPTETKYTKWDDIDAAVDDYQREQRAKAPPATL